MVDQVADNFEKLLELEEIILSLHEDNNRITGYDTGHRLLSL